MCISCSLESCFSWNLLRKLWKSQEGINHHETTMKSPLKRNVSSWKIWLWNVMWTRLHEAPFFGGSMGGEPTKRRRIFDAQVTRRRQKMLPLVSWVENGLFLLQRWENRLQKWLYPKIYSWDTYYIWHMIHLCFICIICISIVFLDMMNFRSKGTAWYVA